MNRNELAESLIWSELNDGSMEIIKESLDKAAESGLLPQDITDQMYSEITSVYDLYGVDGVLAVLDEFVNVLATPSKAT